MDFKKDFWIGIGIGILFGMLIITLLDKKFGPNGELIKQPDTTYSRIKLDSIKFQINKRDTTIYNLKIKLKDDVEKSYNLDDSSSVELFKQLSSSGASSN